MTIIVLQTTGAPLRNLFRHLMKIKEEFADKIITE